MSTREKLRTRAHWLCIAALPAAMLLGCDPAPADSCAEGGCAGIARPLTVAAAATLAPQQAAGVELFVQPPYEFETGRFDLKDVDFMNTEPVVNQRLAIPYDDVEKVMRDELATLTAQPFEGVLDGPLGSSIDWSVGLSIDASFSQRGQPVLRPWGSAADNGVHVDLDTQLEVKLNAHVHIHATAEWIPDPEDFDVPMHALIGGHGRVDLAFFPVIRADGIEAWATLDQSDVDIVGLDGTAIGAGAIIGAGIGYVTGGSIVTDAFIGAVTGEAVLEEAKDRAKDLILTKAAQAFESSRDKLTTLINKVVQPKIAGANDLLSSILNQPIPGLGQTLGQLEAQLGMRLDVRSVVQNDRFRTALTTRFANVPAQGRVAGRLRFPRRRCEYAMADGNRIIGSFLAPVGVVDANAQMHDGGCGAVNLSQLLHQVYYGENPDRVLGTGRPENNLVTWAELGAVQMGEMVENDDGYDCPFSITGLPSAAFVDFSAAADSTLARTLSARQLQEGSDAELDQRLHAREKLGDGRFVLVMADGVAVLLDHTGQDPAVLDIGAKAPTAIGDCPMIRLSDGTGFENAVDSPVPTPEDCPMCATGATPGDDVVNVLDETGAEAQANVVDQAGAEAQANAVDQASASAGPQATAVAQASAGSQVAAVSSAASRAVIGTTAAQTGPIITAKIPTRLRLMAH